jgi:SAM-dependent methyltransferase
VENLLRARVYANYLSARTGTVTAAHTTDQHARSPYLNRLVRRHFPADRDSSILEVGCGSGALIKAAKAIGYRHISGVDGSEEQIAAAHRFGIYEAQLGDIFSHLRNIPDSSLDCVLAFDVIEHFTANELVNLVDEIARVLRPAGRWIVHAPNAEGPFFGRSRYGDITHELAFTRTSISQILLSSRFSEVRCFEDAPIPHGLLSLMRYALWKLIRASLLIYIAVETGELDYSSILSQNFLVVAEREH